MEKSLNCDVAENSILVEGQEAQRIRDVIFSGGSSLYIQWAELKDGTEQRH